MKTEKVRYYHLVARNIKTGKITRLTGYAMLHAACMIMKSKFTDYKWRSIELEEIDNENTK